MKRMVLFLSILGAVALLGAQEQPDQNRPGPKPRDRAAETVTLNGTLGLEQGRIVLDSEEDRYFVAGIRPLVGFVEGLKEGAAVTVEGTVLPARRNGGHKSLRVQKLGLNGKDYELPRVSRSRPDLAGGDSSPDRDGRRDWYGGPGRHGCPDRYGVPEWGNPGQARMRGRLGERGPEWYRGGRHGKPVRPGAR